METVELKRKDAETKATTAKGKVALQVAMQRRASLAKMMAGIAVNPIATYANAGRSGAVSTMSGNVESGNNNDAGGGTSAVPIRDTSGAPSFMASYAATPAGLATYTTRPKLK